MSVAAVMPPKPPATKCAHGLRSFTEAGRWVISPPSPSVLLGSTWPSSRDSVKGRGIWCDGCWCWAAALKDDDVATIQEGWVVEGGVFGMALGYFDAQLVRIMGAIPLVVLMDVIRALRLLAIEYRVKTKSHSRVIERMTNDVSSQ